MRTLMIAAALSTGLFLSQATFASTTGPRHTTTAQAPTKKKHEHHAAKAKTGTKAKKAPEAKATQPAATPASKPAPAKK